MGFPAHAGMDRERERRMPPVRRFPRPRGDGPTLDHQGVPVREVSPPTRGWTSENAYEIADSSGFPAHAGMDRSSAYSRGPAPGFPRPRGDGPICSMATNITRRVSPPTRGWTCSPPARPRHSTGFPAHAGMDPLATELRRSAWWFPRPRGDGPTEAKAAFTEHWVSPPTRGWTLLAAGNARPTRGFPAHAGMDPRAGACLPLFSWFPRPRGDGPR